MADTVAVIKPSNTSTNAKYSGFTVQGTQTDTVPTATWLQKIPDGWYTNAGAAFFKANKNTSGLATGFATAARVLIKYEGGYKTGDIKQIEWAAQADGGVLFDPNK